MSTCVNCYNTSTAAPCASVGCLSTNYGKCITYSGPTLTCEYGGIGTFTFTGTSAGATSGTLIFNSVGGSGSGATFAVTTTLGSPIYTVQVVNPGSGYTEGDILTIPFTFANALSSNWEDITASWEDILDTFGGTSSPVNDITITVVAVSGVLTNGENIDDVIINLHERICLISSNGVQGLDYSGFNYACLRQNGVLTGVGTAITTAREFTESVAAALCNIDPRVTSVEKPNITVPSCFTSTITSGVTGLSSILSQYGSMLCTHNTNLNMTSVGGNPCLTYSFTAKPTSNNVYEYINWITTNMCTIQSDLTNSISAQSTLISTLYSYITGSPTGTVPSVVDTSCLAGGSTTSSLKNAVVLIKDRLCALTTTVTGLSNPTYTVAWACFATSSAGGMIANSPYSSLAAFSSTATITAHLNNISAALNALRMKFSLAEFVLAPNSSTACGTYWDITLKPGNAADFFVYDGAWVGKSLNVTLNGSSSGVTKSVTSGAVSFNLTIPSTSITIAGGNGVIPSYSSGTNTWTIDLDDTLSPPVTPATSASFFIAQGPFHSSLPVVQRVVNQVLSFKANHQVKITNVSGIGQTLTDSSSTVPTLTVFNIPASYRPTSEVFMDLVVKRYNSVNVLQSISHCLAKITTTGDYSIINNSGSNIVMASNDYLLIYVGGTWIN
jgi:hypothetical protein